MVDTVKEDFVTFSVAMVSVLTLGGLVGGVASLCGWPVGLVAGCTTCISAFIIRSRYMAALACRSKALDPVCWQVWINGVKVGQLTDAQFADICYRIMSNPETYVRQLVNLGGAITLTAYKLTTLMIVSTVWIALAVFRWNPEAAAAVQGSLINPAVARQMLPLFLIVGAVLLGAYCYFGGGPRRLGFVNIFRAEMGRLIRLHFRSPITEVEFVLGRYVNGSLVVNDESQYLHRRTK